VIVVIGLIAHNKQDNQLRKVGLQMVTFRPEKVIHEPHSMIGGNLQPVVMIRKRLVAVGEVAPLHLVAGGTPHLEVVKVAAVGGEQFLTIVGITPMVVVAVIVSTKTGLQAVGTENPMKNCLIAVEAEVVFLEVVRALIEVVHGKIRIFLNGPVKTSRMLQTLAVALILVVNLVVAHQTSLNES